MKMNLVLKKILVLLPAVLLGIIYLHDRLGTYSHIKGKRLVFLALTIMMLYGWVFTEVVVRKQKNFWDIGLQASFYVYIFMVLTLTGYFILFREVVSQHWWYKMMMRINNREHVNLKLFQMFRIYKIFSKQIIGNFSMLLPFGVYLPLLYKKISNLFLVFVVSVLVSSAIESLQLITSFRSADVDDIFLNTLGACTGFIMYKFISAFTKTLHTRKMAMA